MHSSPVLPPLPCICMSFTKSRMLPVCRVPFVMPLSCSLAVPCCDKAEAVAGMAEGNSQLTPARGLGLRGRCVPRAPFVCGCEEVLSGGCCQEPAWVLPRMVDVEGWNAPPPSPGRERWALFKILRTAIVLPCPSLSVQGGGRMLPLELLSGAS